MDNNPKNLRLFLVVSMMVIVASWVLLNSIAFILGATSAARVQGFNRFGWPFTFFTAPLTDQQIHALGVNGLQIDTKLPNETILSVKRDIKNLKWIPLIGNCLILIFSGVAIWNRLQTLHQAPRRWMRFHLSTCFFALIAWGIFCRFVIAGVIAWRVLLLLPTMIAVFVVCLSFTRAIRTKDLNWK